MIRKTLFPSFIILIISFFLFSSCKKSRSDIGAVLFKETKNKVYKKFDSTQYYQVFKKMLNDPESDIRNIGVIRGFYKQNEYEPHFIVNLFPKEKLKEVVAYFKNAPSHGLDPEAFHYDELNQLITNLYDKHKIKTVDEAYQEVAKAEILTAASLVRYSAILQYGAVNPRAIFSRYYMKTDRPDSAAMSAVLRTANVNKYLDSIQPRNPEYKKLQDALAHGFQYKGLSPEETAKVIKLNLERLRWKHESNDSTYVWVNIPDFSLTFFDQGKAKLNMKVAVGEPKDANKYQKLQEYDEGDSGSRPHNHETPILGSEIHTIVVNPVWNIPKSIVQSEIAKKAEEDPYYLSNNNIQVYYKGKQIDADNIDWAEVENDKVQFSFKQAPGEDNALGKMKFLFQNASSVYLHDTPAKQVFQQSNRAVSHGCVRVEDPLALANAISGSSSVYNNIEQEYSKSDSNAKSHGLKKKVPVLLDYMTCWVDGQGNIQIRPDVYHLDDILYRKMRKVLSGTGASSDKYLAKGAE